MVAYYLERWYLVVGYIQEDTREEHHNKEEKRKTSRDYIPILFLSWTA